MGNGTCPLGGKRSRILRTHLARTVTPGGRGEAVRGETRRLSQGKPMGFGETPDIALPAALLFAIPA